MRTACRRDSNEPDIVSALRETGASVQPISLEDVPDLLVGYMGRTHLLEVKGPGRDLSPGQAAWKVNWKGSTVCVVRTPDEALLAIGAWKPKRKARP